MLGTVSARFFNAVHAGPDIGSVDSSRAFTQMPFVVCACTASDAPHASAARAVIAFLSIVVILLHCYECICGHPRVRRTSPITVNASAIARCGEGRASNASCMLVVLDHIGPRANDSA